VIVVLLGLGGGGLGLGDLFLGLLLGCGEAGVLKGVGGLDPPANGKEAAHDGQGG